MIRPLALACLFVAGLSAWAVSGSPVAASQGIKLEGSFTTEGGSIPFAALTRAGGELYYGTTISDATNQIGGVYSFLSTTGAITLLDSFTGTNGSVPFAALTPGGEGLYYGTTYSGGGQDLGSVFAFNSHTGAITLLDSFTGFNGANPYAALTPAGGDLYYGTTYAGGSLDLGGVFAFHSGTGAVTLLDSFTGTNGSNPLAGLTPAGGGLFYGTTGHGGSHNLGAIYAFDSHAQTITLVDSFNGPNGAIPHAPLTSAGAGLYYGTTRFGGREGLGAVFAFDSGTGAIILQDSFIGSNGTAPFAALTSAGGDVFYGTAYSGGAQDLGTVFAFNSLAGAITLMDSFTGANGAYPLAALTAGDDGLYYGTTVRGGVHDIGAVYSFNPVPAPLAPMGAGLALAWSRRLRRRARQGAGQTACEPKTRR